MIIQNIIKIFEIFISIKWACYKLWLTISDGEMTCCRINSNSYYFVFENIIILINLDITRSFFFEWFILWMIKYSKIIKMILRWYMCCYCSSYICCCFWIITSEMDFKLAGFLDLSTMPLFPREVALISLTWLAVQLWSYCLIICRGINL